MPEQFKDILIERLLEDEDFCEAFCEGCRAIITIPGDYLNPPETFCPAGFAISDPGCARSREWLRIENAIDQAAEVVTDAIEKGEIAI